MVKSKAKVKANWHYKTENTSNILQFLQIKEIPSNLKDNPENPIKENRKEYRLSEENRAQSRDPVPIGVSPEKEQIMETNKYAISQTSSILITPVQKPKNQDEEGMRTSPSPRPVVKTLPKQSVKQRRQ